MAASVMPVPSYTIRYVSALVLTRHDLVQGYRIHTVLYTTSPFLPAVTFRNLGRTTGMEFCFLASHTAHVSRALPACMISCWSASTYCRRTRKLQMYMDGTMRMVNRAKRKRKKYAWYRSRTDGPLLGEGETRKEEEV